MKTSYLQTRIDPDIKKQFNDYCLSIGSDMSTEITKFIYKTLKK